MIAQRQRLGEIAGQAGEAAEVREPGLVVQPVEADRRSPAVVAEAQHGPREVRRGDGIGQPVGELDNLGIGAVGGGLRFGEHQAIVGRRRRGCKARSASVRDDSQFS